MEALAVAEGVVAFPVSMAAAYAAAVVVTVVVISEVAVEDFVAVASDAAPVPVSVAVVLPVAVVADDYLADSAASLATRRTKILSSSIPGTM